uniref:Putative secreted protein n=1 Tax=Anopheles darlingi TaxID=43151 RepID=A0A2M4D4F0_ANODA
MFCLHKSAFNTASHTHTRTNTALLLITRFATLVAAVGDDARYQGLRIISPEKKKNQSTRNDNTANTWH